MPPFYEEQALWDDNHRRFQEGETKQDPGLEPFRPSMDELDDAFLNRFKIYHSDYFDFTVDSAAVVVSGFIDTSDTGPDPPRVGLPEIPPFHGLDFADFIEHIQNDPNHRLKITATGFCKLSTLISEYESYFETIKIPAFCEEKAAWDKNNLSFQEGETKQDPGLEPFRPSMDELDQQFLQKFKIYHSDYFDRRTKVLEVVVSGFIDTSDTGEECVLSVEEQEYSEEELSAIDD